MDSLTLPMTKEEELIKKVLDTWVLRNGYSEVKANLEGYEVPSSLSTKGSDDKLTPDIMASKRGNRYYIEIVRKDSEPDKTLSKWKLISGLLKNKGR